MPHGLAQISHTNIYFRSRDSLTRELRLVGMGVFFDFLNLLCCESSYLNDKPQKITVSSIRTHKFEVTALQHCVIALKTGFIATSATRT